MSDKTVAIKVRKRDGSVEAFDEQRLRGVIARGIFAAGCEDFTFAGELAAAIHFYLKHSRQCLITSSALFEMTLKAMQRVDMHTAARRLELHRSARDMKRRLLRISHGECTTTLWDKSWLAEFACRSWNVSHRTGRILAGEVESSILRSGKTIVPRGEIVLMLNRLVSQFALADAVPVEMYQTQN
ncbi:MAG TPA: hypothetical protein PKK48_02590 [Phycisphaerae bacterium]|nr:hypothetical protein [Phycisphaerae bacterium]